MSVKKVWLITGAGRGLGLHIAKAVEAAGHTVVATGRDDAKVAAAVGHHANVLAIKLDVTRPEDAGAVVEAASKGLAGSTFSSTTRAISSPASSRSSAPNRSATRSRPYCSAP
jgi:NAD(P)-dependent dehydrogenase (short-subunit alcohol dehydrogenase family)